MKKGVQQTSKSIHETKNSTSKYDLSSNSTIGSIATYIKNVNTMSKSTAHEYLARLSIFESFVSSEYKTTVDNLIKKINKGSADPYLVLSSFSAYLQSNCNNISSSTLKQRVVTAKNFLEYYDVDISPRKFKLKVKLPKVVRKNKEALSKQDIIYILNACSDIRLKTYIMFLATTGCRAVEATSTRVSDLHLDSNPARVFIRGENTKTKVDRYVFLTQEIVSQLNIWLDYKCRTRRVCFKDTQTKKTTTEYRTPTKDPNALIFAVWTHNNPNPTNIYYGLCYEFERTLDRIGKGEFEDDNKRRRKITFHSYRRFVFGTISDLGYSDYASWFIGHIGSTYYRKTVKEKEEIFGKLEPYLTFLDQTSLEARSADIETKLEEREKEIMAIKQKYEQDIKSVREEMEDKFQKILARIDTASLQ